MTRKQQTSKTAEHLTVRMAAKARKGPRDSLHRRGTTQELLIPSRCQFERYRKKKKKEKKRSAPSLCHPSDIRVVDNTKITQHKDPIKKITGVVIERAINTSGLVNG